MRRGSILLLCLGLTACSLPRWPVAGTMTAPFGLRRTGYRLDVHRGVDIAVPSGTPVRAMAPGRVAFAGTLSGYGLVVLVDHPRDVRTVYAHLSDLRVETGQELTDRAVVGLSGSSGRSSAPHLHFEVQRRSRAEDPVQLLGGPPRISSPGS